MTQLAETHVVTCFLLRRDLPGGDHILVLRRSGQVGTYRGRWAGVSGYLEATPLEQAYRELSEEVGLAHQDVRLLAQGQPLEVMDEALGRRWAIIPFLFEVLQAERVRLDWEHTEARWVPPHTLAELPSVPGLAEALARVYPPHCTAFRSRRYNPRSW